MKLCWIVFASLLATAAVAQQNPMTPCMEALSRSPEVQILQSKAPVIFSKQTFDMLTNRDKASGDELPAIRAWAQGREQCQRDTAAYLRTAPPGLAPAVERSYTDFLALLADLYTGELTYGEFAKKRADVSRRLNADIQLARDAYNRGAAQAAEQDDAARRAAAMQLLNRPAPSFQPTTPYQTPSRRPSTTTNCIPDGLGGMRCTTN